MNVKLNNYYVQNIHSILNFKEDASLFIHSCVHFHSKLILFLAEIYPFDGMFVPECVPGLEGDNSPMKRVYKEMQCHRGMCWCMKPDGTIVDGSLSKGPVKCNNKGKYS